MGAAEDAELAFAPARELARLVRKREVSPVAVVEAFGRRIEALNPSLGAYLTLCLDRALQEARAAEEALAGAEPPPFCGVPISVKDLTDVAGLPTTKGLGAFRDRVAAEDAEVVRRLRAAGFIVLGKTSTPELGVTPWTEPPSFGPARNPWAPERTPGGSSGGAAAALAAGLCAAAHGTDGGGSIRIPASCCGVVGLKPSRGRITRKPLASSLLSTDGPLARTVADAAALLDVMAGPAPGDAFWAPPPRRPFSEEVAHDPGRLRVAVTWVAPNGAAVAPGNRRAVEEAARLLEALGHQVAEDRPPWPEGLARDFGVAFACAVAAQDPLPPADALSPLSAAVVEWARRVTAPDYLLVWGRLQDASRRIVEFFDRYDVLVTPTVATPPPLVGEFHDPDNPMAEFARAGAFVPFTPVWNVTGQPAVSLPLCHDELGLPVGVQLVGRPADEATLLRLSAQLEEARPWADRRPPLP